MLDKPWMELHGCNSCERSCETFHLPRHQGHIWFHKQSKFGEENQIDPIPSETEHSSFSYSCWLSIPILLVQESMSYPVPLRCCYCTMLCRLTLYYQQLLCHGEKTQRFSPRIQQAGEAWQFLSMLKLEEYFILLSNLFDKQSIPIYILNPSNRQWSVNFQRKFQALKRISLHTNHR